MDSIEKVHEILSGKTIDEAKEILIECLNDLLENVVDVPIENIVYVY